MGAEVILGRLRYRVAWLRWFIGLPGYRLGDPLLGSGVLREQNRRLLRHRYQEREPQPQHYGLDVR